mgnify:FL=1
MTREVVMKVTMLELLDAVVELLGGQRADSVGPLPVEKYRRLDRARGPIVYVTPVSRREEAVAIGGQFADVFRVELRCEAPWGAGGADGDLLLRLVDKLVAILEQNREVGEARQGRVGETVYRFEGRRDGSHAFVAVMPVEFTADQ